jgi:hypothetical protein
MADTECRIILLSNCLFYGASSIFLKVTYWVTAIIDYINGLPLEKESNYIFAQIAKCRFISNFLGSSLILELSDGAVDQENQTLAKKLKPLGDFAHSFNKHALNSFLSMYQLCSTCWRFGGGGQCFVPLGVSQSARQLQKSQNSHLRRLWVLISEHQLAHGASNPEFVNFFSQEKKSKRVRKGLNRRKNT